MWTIKLKIIAFGYSFQQGMKVATHEADSIYEVVTRPNVVPKTWENPTNPQHQQAFVKFT